MWVWSLSLVNEVGQGNEVGQLIESARWSGRQSGTCCKSDGLDLDSKVAKVVLVARRFWVLVFTRFDFAGKHAHMQNQFRDFSGSPEGLR